MPRKARVLSESGYYHVMLRGNEQHAIFLDDHDRKKYLKLLAMQVEKGYMSVYAYCLMDNHLHLLVYDKNNMLASGMHSIGVAYAAYFNKKYARVGHLFQDRFKSEVIEDEAYLFAALRYIHQNPVRAGMCERVEDYQWSSDGFHRNPDQTTFVCTDILTLIAKDKKKSNAEYCQLMEIEENVEFIDIRKPLRSQHDVTSLVEEEMKQAGIIDVHDKVSLDQKILIVQKLYREHGLSMRQIAEQLGISKGSVQLILRDN